MAGRRFLQPALGFWATLVLAGAPCHGSDQRFVDRIFDSWVASQGGIGTTVLVNGFEILENFEIEGASSAAAEFRVLATRSGHFRTELTNAAMGTRVYGFDGDIGWTARASIGFGLWEGVKTDPLVWQNSLFTAYILVPANSTHLAKDSQSVAGVDCVVASVALAGAEDERCYFERTTKRLVRIVRPRSLYLPGSRALTVDFGDYRKVDGLWIPYLLRVDDGYSIATHKRSKVVINPIVDEGSFVLSTAQVREANDVNRILSRMVARLGSPDAISRIHSRVTHLDVQSPTTGTHSTQTVSQKAPNRVVIESQTVGIGWTVMGFDGKNGWSSSEIEGNRPLKAAEIRQLQFLTNVNFFGQLGASCPYRHLVGERLVNGSPTLAIVLAGIQGPPATYYFEKEGGRLIRIAASTNGESDATVDFSDFRAVDGVEVPFSMALETPVMKTVSRVVSVQNNVELDDRIFLQREDQ